MMIYSQLKQRPQPEVLADLGQEAVELYHHHHHHHHHHDEPQLHQCQMGVGGRSRIVDFYENRSVLITGGSGFIGKVLIEKLLRTCPKIRRIFVLIRPKWNKQPEERLAEILSLPLFDQVRAEVGTGGQRLEDRVLVVEGDVTQANLGLSEYNLLKVMNEVSVIYHSAATVKFDEPLKQSIGINILGTKHMIELCRKIPQLAALVHVSTAYANCDRDQIDEHIYPVDIDPERLIQMASWLDQDTLQELRDRLLAKRPNTYTYTKALSEWLLVKCARDLPVVICRPSIVTASWQEPFPGWIDNMNGPTGIILGSGKGLIRSMLGQPENVADLVPVDTVINLLITLGWFAHVYRNQKTGGPLNELFGSSGESLPGSPSQSAGEDEEELEDEAGETTSSLSASSSSIAGLVERLELSAADEIAADESAQFTHHHHHHHHHLHHHQSLEAINNNNNNNSNGRPELAIATLEGKNAGKVSDLYRATKIHDNLLSPADDGYGSASASPDTKSMASSSSSSLVVVNSGRSIQADLVEHLDKDEQQQQQQQQQRQEKQEQVLVRSNKTGKRQVSHRGQHQVLSFVSAQRRLAEQQQRADFEYKLKQFRHSKQLKLNKKNLPDELADIPVFHCTSGVDNPITWHQISLIVLSVLVAFPISTIIYRVPAGSFTEHRRLDQLYSLLLHYLPAYIVDFFAPLFGTKMSIVKIFRKFDQAMHVLSAFTMRQWRFSPDNRLMLVDELMTPEDKRLFNCDLRQLNWTEYLTNYTIGVRKYVLKEPASNLDEARRNLSWVYFRNTALQLLLAASCMCLVFQNQIRDLL